jgi:hypothetical protein
VSQLPHLGTLPWRRCGRGGRTVWLAYHRALGRDQGREVFAVPGSPLDLRSAGTNNLLKQGAGLVTSARDILSKRLRQSWAVHRRPRSSLPRLTSRVRLVPSLTRVIGALGPSPIDTDPKHGTRDTQSAHRPFGTRSCRPVTAPRPAACLAHRALTSVALWATSRKPSSREGNIFGGLLAAGV